jgi:peroxiredoxin
MKSATHLLSSVLLALALAAGTASAERAEPAAAAPAPAAEVGKAAPEFSLTDTSGKKVKLSDFKGKLVVLEWFNPDCPFVKYAHGDGPLKDMAAQQAAKGVVWLAINSSAAGKQGHGVQRNATARTDWKLGHSILLDDNGHVGRSYGATNTPHMFVIDKKGVLVYAGALDNAPFGEVKGGGADKIPYVVNALDALRAGKPIAVAKTPAYGCSVKYAN